jgi:hypothetical protein
MRMISFPGTQLILHRGHTICLAIYSVQSDCTTPIALKPFGFSSETTRCLLTLSFSRIGWLDEIVNSLELRL